MSGSSDGVEWLEESTFDVGYCVTFARGLSAVELLRRMGCDVATAAMKSPIDANHWIEDIADELGHQAVADREWVIRAGEADGWAFAVEDGGVRGIDSEVLAAVSAGTVAMSTYRSINAENLFIYAEFGSLLCGFDTPLDRWGDEPDRLVPQLIQAGLLLPDGADPDRGIGEEQRLTQRMMHTEFGVTLPRADVEHGELLTAMY
ncbi:DUF6461 domain-containing protein [Embleya sp. AB8]|uniref:DUF6461 domain-containing protein n=1 Tax=Embleya sp. AB8 TaxID=3156304 RepID=UPI003C74609D